MMWSIFRCRDSPISALCTGYGSDYLCLARNVELEGQDIPSTSALYGEKLQSTAILSVKCSFKSGFTGSIMI